MTDEDIATYFDFACRAAQRSKATRLKVGAVLVNPNRVMALGYNGTPSGWDNRCESTDNVTLPEVIHGEMNCIFKFVQDGISTVGSHLFLTHSPCLPCAQIIFLAGIAHVHYIEHYRSRDGIDFLIKAGIGVTQVER